MAIKPGNIGRWSNCIQIVGPSGPVAGSWWAGLYEKASRDAPMQTGLRLPTLVEFRAHAFTPLSAGCHVYLRDNRLFYVTAVRGAGVSGGGEVIASAIELSGQPAQYMSRHGQQTETRAHVMTEAVLMDGDNSPRSEYRYRIEVPLVECPRPQPQDVLIIGGVSYGVIGLIDSEDDGIVRAVWGAKS